jgi:hypothetical protein
VVLLVCFDKNGSWVRPFNGEHSGWVDASIVTAHMMLQAADIGLGSTWVMHFDAAKIRRGLICLKTSYQRRCCPWAARQTMQPRRIGSATTSPETGWYFLNIYNRNKDPVFSPEGYKGSRHQKGFYDVPPNAVTL